MIFISRGQGGWIFGFLIIAMLVAVGVDKYLLTPEAHRAWPYYAAFAGGGLACIVLGMQARLATPRMVLEQQTGRELMLRPIHSAYGIRAEYWGLFFIALGAYLLTLPAPRP